MKNGSRKGAEAQRHVAKAGVVHTEKVAQGLDSSGEWIELSGYWGKYPHQRYYALRRELLEPMPGVEVLGWKAVRIVERTVIQTTIMQHNIPEAGKS